MRAVELEDFLGDWRDTMGNQVRVDWSRPGNRGGQLDVLLIKPHSTRDPIRLNVKVLGRGQFACGHYELEVSRSHSDKIVWCDVRNRSKYSEWVRGEVGSRARSRSRSRSRRRHRSRSRRKHRSRSRSRRHRDRSSGDRDRDRDERDWSPSIGQVQPFPPPISKLPGPHPHAGSNGAWPGGLFPGPPPPSLPGLPPPAPWPGAPGGKGGGCWSPWAGPLPPNYGWPVAAPGPPPAAAAGIGAGEGADGVRPVITSTRKGAGDGQDLYADLQGGEPAQPQLAVQSRSVWSQVSTPGAWAPPAPSQPAQQQPLPQPLQQRSPEILRDDAPTAVRNLEPGREADGVAAESLDASADAGSPQVPREDALASAIDSENGSRAEGTLPEPDRSIAPRRDTGPEAVIILNPDGLDESQVSQQVDSPGLEDIVEPSAPNPPQGSSQCSPAAPAEPAQATGAACIAASPLQPAVEVVLSVDAGRGAQSDVGRATDPRDPRRRRPIPSPQKAAAHIQQPEPERELHAQRPPQESSASAGPQLLQVSEAPNSSKDDTLEKEKLLLAYDALLLGGEAAVAGASPTNDEANAEQAPWKRQRRLRG